jgi:hypothetical protein
MSDEHIDVDDLAQDVAYKGCKTPHQIMEEKFYGVYNGQHKPYLASIEWDDWCKRYSKSEQAERLIEINKRKAEVELKHHPFNKFF